MLIHSKNPNEMTAEERFQEIASLLAQAILRTLNPECPPSTEPLKEKRQHSLFNPHKKSKQNSEL